MSPRTGPADLRLADVLSPRDLILLYGAAERRSLPGRDLPVFQQGEPCEGLYDLLSGRVRLARMGPGERRQIVRYVEPGSAFDPAPVFDGGTNPLTATTVEPSEVLVIPREHALAVILASPFAAVVLMRVLSTQLRNTVALVGDLAFHHVPARLARVLLQDAMPHDGAGAGMPVLGVTRHELAEITGTSRRVLGRSLRAFETAGVIRNERGRIRVTDTDVLQRFAEIA